VVHATRAPRLWYSIELFIATKVLYFSTRRGAEGIESDGRVEYAKQTSDDGGGQHEMIWLAWLMLALESLVIAIGLWLMWAMVSEASRAPSEAFPPAEDSPAHPPEHPPEASDDPARFILEEVDERGYVSSRKLHMGCEAAICRTPLGARIVAGRRSLKEPQYAWDYASVRLADKALAYAEFNTHPTEGIIGVEDLERGAYPAAEPGQYLRRWRYTPEGRMERL
jgi:hypothetical protein